MKLSARLFSLWDIPVSADISWFLIAIAIAPTFLVWGGAEQLSDTERAMLLVIGPLGLALSILLHEFSHALVALKHQIETEYIHLTALGGIASPKQQFSTPGSEFLVAIAGPISSVFLGLGLFALYFVLPSGLLSVGATQLACINIVLAVFNMCPAFPMDGGRVFHAFLWKLHGSPSWSGIVASAFSLLFALCFLFLGVLESHLLLVLIALFLMAINLVLLFDSIEKRGLEIALLEALSEIDPSSRCEVVEFSQDSKEASLQYVISRLQKSLDKP